MEGSNLLQSTAVDAETSHLLKKLILKERVAHLATLRNSAPMASMTLYLPEKDLSAFYVHVSCLAWHTQDMAQDPRVALSIAETDDGRADPFTLMRVTVRGEALQTQDRNDELKSRWLERFPAQAINFELADFSFWKITPRDARFVAGFGRIHNLSAEQLKIP
jgi:heme oxygenase (biliverdin-IX-beta and delta-forming)